MTKIRSYTELSQLTTFEERYEYLKLEGSVGKDTFGFDRYLNQLFYTSMSWRRLRSQIIIRDSGCDLGISGMEIHRGLFIHHINPLTVSDVTMNNDDVLFNPENLITTTQATHNAIHYGSNNVPHLVIARTSNDTKLW